MKIFSPRPRIVLTIGDDCVVVVPHAIPGTTPFFVPFDDKRGVQEVINFIAHYPKARLTLFADNLTQDYRGDDLPPLNPFDKAKIVARRLKMTFPSARLVASLPFKNFPRRRLMIGMHESNPVFAWAERLRTRLPVIALLPVEGARMAAKLMPQETKNGWAMLISRQKSGGFRQIVTYKNDLVFTRLTPLPPAGDSGDDMNVIARDIKASLDYLTRHGLHDPKQLSVLLLTQKKEPADKAFEKLSLNSIRFLSPAQAAKQLELPFAPEEDDETADILFAAHLLKHLRPSLPLMLPDMRETWLTQTFQFWGMRVACASLAVVVALTLWRAGDLATTLYQTQKEALQLVKTRHTLAEAQSNAAPLTEPLGRMRQALERRHIYDKPAPMPWTGLNEMTGGLDEDSRIVKLEWLTDGETASENFNVSVLMTNEASSGDRAEAVDAFSRVAQNIARAMPDYEIKSVKPPYPALPDEFVTAAGKNEEEPMGEISLGRKSHD